LDHIADGEQTSPSGRGRRRRRRRKIELTPRYAGREYSAALPNIISEEQEYRSMYRFKGCKAHPFLQLSVFKLACASTTQSASDRRFVGEVSTNF
jgi:hypothetical protein